MDTTADRITVWMLFILIVIATAFLAWEGGMEAGSLKNQVAANTAKINELATPSFHAKYMDVTVKGEVVVEGGK